MTPSAQVVVTAIVNVKPEARDEALAALTTGIEGTHGEEGCIAYALHEDTNQPARFVIVEKWATQAALEAHGQADHLKAMFAVVGPLLTEPPTIVFTQPLPVGDEDKSTI
ncbi:Putative monooxygenase YcnE [Baekduia alba]|uniref:putative quinol monooxygenase n=1 Tax=Baekduia alba TaxID=2997333 RepID=UPI00233FBF47|nr:putative quinol monooxygenase [Baekduia alba]WCB93697.1 Putative monooxygenase YcnE [Baekduia alba]